MTLPTSIIFPLHNDQILSGDPKQMDRYIRELVTTMTDMYGNLAQAVNGLQRSNYGAQDTLWTPIIRDTLNGGITYTYVPNQQIGWVLRRGIIVDVWFDVTWTAASAVPAGNMYLELPYQVAFTDQRPFVGVVQSSNLTFTGGTGVVINAISNTFRGEIWNVGNAFVSANQASVAAGRIAGHIRYIGKNSERSN